MKSYKRPFFIRIARFADDAIVAEPIELHGHFLKTYQLPTGPSSFDLTFEQLQSQLEAIHNLQFELDGCFFWYSDQRDDRGHRLWSLDGMIYDRDDRVERVELKGNCDRVAWQRLCQTLVGVKLNQVIVQLVDHGKWVVATDFESLLI